MITMYVNLGCGKDVRPGWVNVDRHPFPGVTVADAERDSLPFPDGSVDVVYASHFLEHVFDLERVIREVHRILKPDGIFEVRVPHGLKSLYDPWHQHAFNLATFDRFTREDLGLQSAPFFAIRLLRCCRGPPFEWHLKKYVPSVHRWLCGDGRHVDWPVGVRREIHAVLVKR